MNARKLADELEESMLADDLVMVRVVDPTSELNGRMFKIENVSGMFDHHDDGSTTAWIEVVEY